MILDVCIRSELSKKEEKLMKQVGSGKDTRKLYISVRWTWNRLQKACTDKQKRHILETLVDQARNRKHTCWMPEYANGEGLADTANETEIVVIPKMKMIACMVDGHTALRQDYIDRWARKEIAPWNNSKVPDWFQAEGEDAAQHSITGQDLGAELQDGNRKGVDIYQAEGEDATQHSIAGKDLVAKLQDGNRKEVDIYQAEGEDAMQHSIAGHKRQCWTLKNACEVWGECTFNGRWFECPHGAVRISGRQIRPFGFTMDGSPMPRCKRPECIKKMQSKSGDPYYDASQSDASSKGEGGINEISKVLKTWTQRRNMKVICLGREEVQVLRET